MADINGGFGNDLLFGTPGNDRIIGWEGADQMTGGLGNDIYYVDNPGDVVHESPGGGWDMIVSTIPLTWAMPEVEQYAFATSVPVTFIGNVQDNIIQGGSGNDVIAGYGGQDQIMGGAGNDALLGWTGKDQLYGDDGNDTLNGLGNDDVLNGDAGADTMYGGDGNDTFFIDNPGDTVVEYTGGGTDKVYIYNSAGLTHAIDNIETYVFAVGTKAAHFTGSAGNEEVQGDAGNDVIHGGGGTRDWLVGWDGNDQLYLDSGDGYLGGANGSDKLYGGAGHDTLDGGAGADVMTGGGGNDIYWVDDAGDRIIEAAGGGSGDSVWTWVSLSSLAAANVEDVLIAGTGKLNVTGNALGNHLTGNDDDNALNGAVGNDHLFGGLGNDSLTGGAGSDAFAYYLTAGRDQGDDRILDFDRSADRLQFNDVGDRNGDHVINLADLLLDVTGVIDHGAGHDVTVNFNNGTTITFAGAGTGAIAALDQVVASPTRSTF